MGKEPVATKLDYVLRSRPLLKVAVTLLFGELLAFALLKLGVGLPISLGVPFGVVVIYITWPIFPWALLAIAHSLAKAANLAAGRLRNRRTYRFRLTTLLLVVVLIAAVSAWYARRLDKIHSERFGPSE
jgi:hypothetical protein